LQFRFEIPSLLPLHPLNISSRSLLKEPTIK
jgi:hypothetical protein